MAVATDRQSRAFADVAYRERSFPALRLARSSRIARRVAKAVLFLMVVVFAGMFYVPWQQSVAGSGSVIAYDPSLRPQSVDAPIGGRIVNWSKNVFEGAVVKKDETLFEIEVVDMVLKTRLQEQLTATERKLAADLKIVEAYRQQVDAFEDVKKNVELSLEQLIQAAMSKVRAEEREVDVTRADWEQSEIDRRRREELFALGTASEFERDLAVRKEKEARGKLAKAQAYLQAAEKELESKRFDLVHKSREAQAKIDSANAVFEKSLGDVQSTQKEIADIRAKQTLQTQPVKAPLDGIIVKLTVAQGGQLTKQGDPLFEIVPDTTDRAVALKIDGNDVPLAATLDDEGNPRKVRLQFEGWPAVQFSGWPSVAIGTFGGIVKVVDQTDDGTGKFRVLVIPDPDDRHDWPDEQILRQGTRCNGWVLLNVVPLGQELWRQLNGFPPVATFSTSEKKSDDKLLRSKK